MGPPLAQARVHEAHDAETSVAAIAVWSDSSAFRMGDAEYNAGVVFQLWVPQAQLRKKAAYRTLWICPRFTAAALGLDDSNLSETQRKKLCAPCCTLLEQGLAVRHNSCSFGQANGGCAALAWLTPRVRGPMQAERGELGDAPERG